MIKTITKIAVGLVIALAVMMFDVDAEPKAIPKPDKWFELFMAYDTSQVGLVKAEYRAEYSTKIRCDSVAYFMNQMNESIGHKWFCSEAKD